MIRKVQMIGRAMRSGLPLLVLATLSTAAAPDRFDGPIEDARRIGELRLDGELFHVQGLELERNRIWVTSVDEANRKAYLHAFDRRSGKFLRRLELTDGARYHPGGISLSGRSIWVPVAEYRARSSAILVEVDADSLEVRRKIPVADHLGFVAASGDTLVAGNWDGRLLYVFDLSKPAAPRVVPNPSATRHQDMKFVGNQLVAGGAITPWSGAVDWIDWPSMKVVRTLRAGAIGPIRPIGRGGPYTGEGMAIEGRDLYVVPEDGPSRMFHFRLDDRGGDRPA
ncbi:hypothetical protein DAH55_03270 [Sphingomonas koreensis]|uniref:DUF6454 family protein n=1 Tax=Sphingomonas koreensis TaxID=93064 RepID=UPI0008322A58|nr:DUF6454 family protein [Sphingomonas koreensis]PJI89178.1 hypothetical protein BDW16_2486 [Sphingomonas koreensis]RSU59681.1 hypothetical protein DAH56_10220 [Sphingomonas koreensis]RSU70923.1 hypothetical protein DAH55_03270 [Sphingomonas koreensis]